MKAGDVPFTPPPSVSAPFLRVLKVVATRIRGKSNQALKSSSVEPGTSSSAR